VWGDRRCFVATWTDKQGFEVMNGLDTLVSSMKTIAASEFQILMGDGGEFASWYWLGISWVWNYRIYAVDDGEFGVE
jgi:hypothetical protein